MTFLSVLIFIMESVKECPVCMEPFQGNIYKIQCGSSVEHQICLGCADKWTSAKPGQDMTCPTCRQPDPTQRVEPDAEVGGIQIPIGVIEQWEQQLTMLFNNHQRAILDMSNQPQVCASGRICVRHWRNRRIMTRLKCRQCGVVACCYRCRFCTVCIPRPE